MADKIKTYSTDDIDVNYSLKRCIHAEECVRGLQAVFDPKKRPWIQPDQGTADQIAEVIVRCPSGALHFERNDGSDAEATPDENTIRLSENGPLYVRGNITILTSDGEILLQDTRVALCRCGSSLNKPFCDNRHKDIDFRATATVKEPKTVEGTATGEITLQPTANGPIHLKGNFTILNQKSPIWTRISSNRW